MLSLLLVVVLNVQAAELIERTLAIVGGQAVTLSDVQTALSLDLIIAGEGADRLGTATARLIDRTLILREVERYAPPEPLDAAIDRRLVELRTRFAAGDRFAQVLAAGGFTEARVRAWLRDDMRIASYLDQRFAAVGMPSDEEVSAFYTSRRAEFEREQLTFDQATPVIRERLSAQRRTELIGDWIEDLRRRTVVLELWKTKP